MNNAEWIDVGSKAELEARPLQQVLAGKRPIALSCKDGSFAAISGACNHVGGPLGDGVGCSLADGHSF